MDSAVMWYAGQATGIVSLVLFTLVMALGIGVRERTRIPGMPRLATVALHRSLSLLAVVFMTVHIVTAVADSYVNISPLAALVPFSSSYRPLWVGLGTVAVDLMLAVVATSLLRARLGRRAWRAVHWLAYASWPVAVLHGVKLGNGTGHLMSGWMLWLTAGCVGSVLAAILYRVTAARRRSTPDSVLTAAEAPTADWHAAPGRHRAVSGAPIGEGGRR
ncbi:ferric reductase-like transmembrane domain-containing protein [Catenulispora subtropica]|uniref:Ferric reductase-like transmembrane domain-containing protein n=1 Tax=Catenulispora subtropica TaxID=450798 RepID=A0ABP5C3D7_9ACTN